MKNLLLFFEYLRPHQWIKNFLIFIPFLAAHQINKEIIMSAILIFISFSLMASSVYILNDLMI